MHNMINRTGQVRVVVGGRGLRYPYRASLPRCGLNNKEVMAMRDEEKRHIQAQIKRLRADAERHMALADELEAQADRMAADLNAK